MMGHREKLKTAMEWDALTKGGKRVHSFRSGVRKALKRAVNKRLRREELPGG